jgi:S1-C subfamily serine protease
MVIAPGIAVTNAHNRRFISGPVIGEAAQSDLLFFRVTRSANPATAAPVVGAPVIAYGQGADAELRVARGVVREIVMAPGYDISRWFTFEADAGPGFSGGPVVDAQGRLVGITFAYKDEGDRRLMYAYEMTRVRAELQALQKPLR